MTIVKQLRDQVEQALVLIFRKNEFSLPDLSSEKIFSLVRFEPCKRPDHGDFSCAVAMRLAQGRDISAIALAQELSALINERNGVELFTASVLSPGFINFTLTTNFLSSVLFEIHSCFSEIDDLCFEAHSDKESKNCYQLCCSILRCATEPAFDLINEAQLAPLFTAQEWQECKLQYKRSIHSFIAAFDSEPNLFMRQKNLILMLDRAVSMLAESTDQTDRQLQSTTSRCRREIVDSFAKFYQGSRIFTDQVEVTGARLGLVLAVKLVLEQTLRLQSEKASELR